MSEKVVALASKPSVEDEIKADIINILQEMIELTKNNEVKALFLVAIQPDEHWLDRRSAVTRFADIIGKLEIVKHNWINSFISANGA